MRCTFGSALSFGCIAVVFGTAWSGASADGLSEASRGQTAGVSNSVAPTSPAKQAPRAGTSAELSRLGSTQRLAHLLANEPAVTNQTRHALNFYGGYSARATLSQLPRRTPIRAAPPRPMQAQLKPFNAVQPDSTISPYLNLDRPETADNLPNYFAFVRPQFQQIDTNRGQQRDLGRLQRQLNSVSATIINPQQTGGASVPGTGTPSRFMDTAQFYGGWRR